MFASMAGSFARQAVEDLAHSALPDAPQHKPVENHESAPPGKPYTLRFRLAGVLHALADRIAPVPH